jgi:hypothetical protein
MKDISLIVITSSITLRVFQFELPSLTVQPVAIVQPADRHYGDVNSTRSDITELAAAVGLHLVTVVSL